MWIAVVIALLLSLAALGLAASSYAAGRTRRSEPVEALPEDVHGLRQEVAALRSESQHALTHVATVRYDAFGDMGGHLSWSLALLDSSGSGVLVTSIHGRSDSRTYAKNIDTWSCDQPLSPEEEEAIEQARG